MPLFHEFDDRVRFPALLSRQRKEEAHEGEAVRSGSDRHSVRADAGRSRPLSDPGLLEDEGDNCGSPSVCPSCHDTGWATIRVPGITVAGGKCRCVGGTVWAKEDEIAT